MFYAAGPTDLPVDESIPGALERYEEFYAQVPDLLASFSLINGGAYAAAQTRLEEQEAVETFQENSPYVNQEYGFTLTLPDGWADQFGRTTPIRRMELAWSASTCRTQGTGKELDC